MKSQRHRGTVPCATLAICGSVRHGRAYELAVATVVPRCVHMKRTADGGGHKTSGGGGLECDRAPAISLQDHSSTFGVNPRRAVGCDRRAQGAQISAICCPLLRSSRSACEWESQLENETGGADYSPCPWPLVTPFQIRRFCAGRSVMVAERFSAGMAGERGRKDGREAPRNAARGRMRGRCAMP